MDQTDVIIYGDDLLDYVQREFGSQNMASSRLNAHSLELRDRLRVQAVRDGLTLGAHLAHLAEADDRAQRLSDLRTAIAHTSGTSAALYAAEAAEWERTELSDMTA